MSRAFVKESAESARPPERMVEEGPNPVTPEGMAQIEAHVTRLETSLKSEANVLLRETLERDLRYWSQRKLTADVVQPSSDAPVPFGWPSSSNAMAASRRFVLWAWTKRTPPRV